MLVALLIVGIVLIVFGGFVLLRFSDRPGGEFEFHGMKIHSVGAGLPLIVLGVVAVVLAVSRAAPDEAATVVAATPSATTSTVAAGQPATTATSRPRPAAPTSTTRQGSCLDEHLEKDPKAVITERLPEGNTVPLTIATTALILMRGIETIGAIRVEYHGLIGVPELTIYDVVDASCQPGTWETMKIPKGFIVSVVLPDDQRYEITVDYESGVATPKATLRSPA